MRDPQQDLRVNTVTHATLLETIRHVNPTGARRAHVDAAGVRPADCDHRSTRSTRPARSTSTASPSWRASSCTSCTHTAYGLADDRLRLTNVYGPRQRLTSDELGFLPVFIRKALLGEPIEIFGDGAQRRDCVYVDDVVEALLARHRDRTRSARVFNVGQRDRSSLAEIAAAIIDAAGSTGGLRLVAVARRSSSGSTSARSTPTARPSPPRSGGRATIDAG